MEEIIEFIQANRSLFDAAQALSSVVNLLGWCLGSILLYFAWRRNSIKTVTVGPISFQMQEAAVTAAAAAARDWQAKSPSQKVDVPQIRATVSRAFSPTIAENLTGKSILWVDDNPSNNRLLVRTLERLGLDVEQAISTDTGLLAMQVRRFDLVISDMGRGANMRAGYDLLKAIREQGNQVPFLVFAGSDTPQFRREAAERGAQLSTNDMLELMDWVVNLLGER